LPPGTKYRVPLIVPRILSLEKNYAESMTLVADLRNLVLRKGLPVFLRFDNVEEIELAALLCLTAELYRCRRFKHARQKSKFRFVNGNYPKDTRVYKQLAELRFFELLQIPHQETLRDQSLANGRRTLAFRTDEIVDPVAADAFLSELTRGHDLLTDENQRDLQACLIEAMKNAVEHAYKFDKELKHSIARRWWLTGTVSPDQGELGIVLLDQGHGIPRTLDRTLFEHLDAWRGKLRGDSPDSKIIEAATQIGRTSTHLQGRGKGFTTMIKFVERCHDGELLVYSSRGSYLYSRRQGTVLSDGNPSIGGTLVQWRIMLKRQGAEEAR
jgi:hypothetical protein